MFTEVDSTVAQCEFGEVIGVSIGVPNVRYTNTSKNQGLNCQGVGGDIPV